MVSLLQVLVLPDLDSYLEVLGGKIHFQAHSVIERIQFQLKG